MSRGRYDMALNQEEPPELVKDYFDNMNILKPSEINIYDNLYAKPTQLGPPLNYRFSMGVCFAVNNVIYDGQYDFEEGTWTTSPGDEKKRKFKDRAVQFWFYPPGTLDMFKRYHADVVAGTNGDQTSRTREYDPEEDIFEKEEDLPSRTASPSDPEEVQYKAEG